MTADGLYGRSEVAAGSGPVFERSRSVRPVELPDGFLARAVSTELDASTAICASWAIIVRPIGSTFPAETFRWRKPAFRDGIVLREEQEMMKVGFEAVDADGHVHEEDILFTEYLEPAYRERTQGWVLNADRNRRFVVNGEEHPPFPVEISVRKPMPSKNRVKVLDKEGVRLAVLFPSAALVAGYMEPGFAAAMMRAYNSWMSDWCALPFSHKFCLDAVAGAARRQPPGSAIRMPAP